MNTAAIITIESVECHRCHAVYGLSSQFRASALQDSNISWHCPYCQTGSAYSQTENTKLRAQIAQLETQKEWAEKRETALRDTNQHLRNSRAVTKGHLTRICKRVKAGVCPCCNRTFTALAQHMHTQHPNYKEPIAP